MDIISKDIETYPTAAMMAKLPKAAGHFIIHIHTKYRKGLFRDGR